MVRRSEAVKPQKNAARKGGKGRKKHGDEEEYQRAGKLMLNNPLIPVELDEDIDDDLAFNSEDERLYGDFFAQKPAAPPKLTKKKSKKSAHKVAHLDDDDDEFLEDGLVLAGVVEGKKQHSKAASSRRTAADDDLDNYQEEGQSSGDDEDYIDLSDMLDMSLKAEKNKKGKTKTKQSSRETETGVKVSKKRRAAEVTAEPESVYGVVDASEDGGAGSYNATMRRIMRQKNAATSDELEAVKGRIEESMRSKHNLLTVDSDDMTKERLTRREVRTIVEEGLEKYRPVLKELDSAKHIQFPMHLPESTPVASSVGGIVAAADAQFRSDRPVPEAQANSAAYRLGRKMDALLAQAGLSRRQVTDAADTPNSIGNYVKFGDGDVTEGTVVGAGREGAGEAPSTSYMAKLKSMLAYENSRRKRLNKIKSKTYRRILRKEKDREKERREKAFELLHPELARERLAERMLKARAEERVTQKHKNTSAWVKHAKRFAEFDGNTKDAIDDQHATHQHLMQKMEQDAGENNYEKYMAGDGDSEASSEEDRAVDLLMEKVGASGGAPLSKTDVQSVLWSSVDAAEEEGGVSSAKASPMTKARAELRDMKFMRNAREREDRAYEDEMETLRCDIETYQREERGEGEAKEGDVQPRGIAATGASITAGRATFKAAKKATSVEEVQLRKQKGIHLEHDEERGDEDGEAVRSEVDAESIASSRSSSVRVERETALARSKNKMAAAVSDFAGSRPAAQAALAQAKKAVTSTRVTILPRKRVRADEGSAAPAVEKAEEAPEEDLRLHQEYLISRAFAQDDVDEDFVKEKESQVETIMRPEDKNQSMPGWGEWGGEDPELNRHHREVVEHDHTQRQIEKSFLLKSRADAALEHVIINHDGVELVPDRMTLHMVPRPFSNPQEFARSMRQPMGPEWTSALSFKDGVQPRVEVRQGQSVLPLDLSLRKQKTKTKRRKTETTGSRRAA